MESNKPRKSYGSCNVSLRFCTQNRPQYSRTTVLVNTGDVYSDYHPLYVRNASRKVDKVDIKGKTVSVVYDTGLFALAPTNANNSGHNNMRSFNIRKRLNKILTWSTAQGVSNAAGQYYFVIVTSAAATAYSFGCSYYYIDL